MAERKPDQGAAAAPPSLPNIVLTFDGPGLANVSIATNGVTASQLYVAAWYLEAIAREVRAGSVAKAAMEGRLTPSVQQAVDDILAIRRAPGRSD